MDDARTSAAVLVVALFIASLAPAQAHLADDAEPVYDPNTDLIARRTSSPPTIDGVADSVWDDAVALETFATGNNGNFYIYLKALFDDDNVYMLATWDEFAPAKADKDRDAWELSSNATPGTWDHKSWGEDRLSLLLQDPDNPVEEFDVQGCDAVCHDNNEDMFTANAGEMLDVWVWSVATTNPQGYADDGVLLNNNTVTPDPRTMHVEKSDLAWDSGTEGWIVNNDTSAGGARPTHVWAPGATPTDPSYMFDSDAQEVNWATFDITTVPTGTMVPGHVLKTPAGDRADVQAKGAHNGTGWTVEFQRARNTGSGDDIPMVKTNAPYYFSPSITNNMTGDDHSKGITAYKLWLAEPDQPDLVAERINPVGGPFTLNSTATVGIFVDNIGWADAQPTRLEYHWDVPGTPLQRFADVDAIPWGEDDYVEVAVPTDDPGLVVGNNTLLVTVDADGAVTEINETNNAGNITLDLAPEPLPDLEVSSMVLDPPEATVGGLLEVTITVLNNGTNASSGGKLHLHLDDVAVPLAVWDLPDLDIGATDQFIWNSPPIDYAEGNHTLNATVDPDGDVKELEEGDNVASVTFQVVPPTLPDLVVESVLFTSTLITQGAEVDTQVTVKNEGGDAAAAPFEIALFLDQAFTSGDVGVMATLTVTEDLPAGGNLTEVLEWTMPADASPGGDHFVRVQVDWTGAVVELDEGNNNATVEPITVLRKKLPDMVIESVSPANPTVKQEKVLNLTIVVKNAGEVPSSQNNLSVRDTTHNTTIPFNALVPALGSNATATLYFEWHVPRTVKTGEMVLQFIVDAGNYIAEESEFNNAMTVRVVIEPADLADLWVPPGGITFVPMVPRIGDAVTISIKVENKGSLASENTTLVVEVGNDQIANQELLALGTGENRTVDVLWLATNIVTAMEYGVLVRLDPENRLKELNDTNEFETTITFVKAPRPALENLVFTASKAKVTQGKTVEVTVTIDNTGDEADIVTIVVEDGGTEIATRTALTVAAGGQREETFELKLKGTGEHALRVTIYADGEVAEDPQGNQLVADLTVKVKKKEEDPGFGLAVAVLALLGAVLAASVSRRHKK